MWTLPEMENSIGLEVIEILSFKLNKKNLILYKIGLESEITTTQATPSSRLCSNLYQYCFILISFFGHYKTYGCDKVREWIHTFFTLSFILLDLKILFSFKKLHLNCKIRQMILSTLSIQYIRKTNEHN